MTKIQPGTTNPLNPFGQQLGEFVALTLPDGRTRYVRRDDIQELEDVEGDTPTTLVTFSDPKREPVTVQGRSADVQQSFTGRINIPTRRPTPNDTNAQQQIKAHQATPATTKQ